MVAAFPWFVDRHVFLYAAVAASGAVKSAAVMSRGRFSPVKGIVACAVALACAALCGRASLAAPAPASPMADLGVIAPDPDVRQGVLPNGLHYAVMRNATPKGSVSIRFALLVGSYEETDDERGLAHFLEHMAFDGSAHFPVGSLDQTFADMGVGFGRDQNAETSLSVTEYQLDLNDSDNKKLDLAFRWVRDIADGDLLDEAAVERERGVILSEREARLSPAQKTRTAGDAFREQGPALAHTRADRDGRERLDHDRSAVARLLRSLVSARVLGGGGGWRRQPRRLGKASEGQLRLVDRQGGQAHAAGARQTRSRPRPRRAHPGGARPAEFGKRLQAARDRRRVVAHGAAPALADAARHLEAHPRRATVATGRPGQAAVPARRRELRGAARIR